MRSSSSSAAKARSTAASMGQYRLLTSSHLFLRQSITAWLALLARSGLFFLSVVGGRRDHKVPAAQADLDPGGVGDHGGEPTG